VPSHGASYRSWILGPSGKLANANSYTSFGIFAGVPYPTLSYLVPLSSILIGITNLNQMVPAAHASAVIILSVLPPTSTLS